MSEPMRRQPIVISERTPSRRKPGVVYITTFDMEWGFVSCTCDAFKFNKRCYHVTGMLNTYGLSGQLKNSVNRLGGTQ